MGPDDERSVQDRADDNEVIDLRDGGGWEANLAYEDFGDSDD